jgi:RimJ/RimL family protein N-acetyltransferase
MPAHEAVAPPRSAVQAGSADDGGAPVRLIPATPAFLRTRRLVLSELAFEQALDLLRLGLESRVARHILDAPLNTLAEIVALVEHARRLYREHPGLGIWYATDRNGFVGIFSLVPSTEQDAVEIGTRLLPRAWGRGYALEGGAALCEHAFGRLGLPGLIGLCVPDNRSVPPLLERLGFRADGTTTQFGRPALRFALRREQWSGPRTRREARAGSAAGVPDR